MSGRRQCSIGRGINAQCERGLLPLLVVAAFGTLALIARGREPDPAEIFRQAREVYDAGNFRAAIERYESLLTAGYDLPEVRFNLGNALYRSGDASGAIAQYRMAQYRRPRDPDIAANLRFVSERVGAAAPSQPLIRVWLRRLSEDEWRAVAAVAWGLLGLIVCVALLWRARRGPLLKASLLPAAVLLVALAGLAEWGALRRYPEAVALRAETQARFAPLEDATVSVSVPAGTIVRVIGRDGAWARIELDRREGWVRETDLLVLSWR